MPNSDYEEKFRDVMKFVKIRLDGQGKSVRIRDQEDLKTLFERLDETRRPTEHKGKGEKRMTSTFINGLLQTKGAENIIGRQVGRFQGNNQKIRTPQSRRFTNAKAQGKTLLPYPGGYVFKSPTKGRYGNLVVRFRDVDTGKFIRKSVVENEEV